MAMKRRIAAQIAQLNKGSDAQGLRAPLLAHGLAIQTGSGVDKPISSMSAATLSAHPHAHGGHGGGAATHGEHRHTTTTAVSKGMSDPPSPTSPDDRDGRDGDHGTHDSERGDADREPEDADQSKPRPSRLKRTISRATKLTPVPLGVKLRWDSEIARKTLYVNLNAWLGIALMVVSLQAGWDQDTRVRSVCLFGWFDWLVCLSSRFSMFYRAQFAFPQILRFLVCCCVGTIVCVFALLLAP